MVFASIDSDGYGEAGSIVIFTALPPLGWDRYTELDNTFPRGASTAGGSGGYTIHSHSVTIETNGPSTLSSAAGGLVNTATDTHTHSCSTTTSSQDNEPPYIEVIYGQREDPAPSTSMGSEEAVSSGGGGITYQLIGDSHSAIAWQNGKKHAGLYDQNEQRRERDVLIYLQCQRFGAEPPTPSPTPFPPPQTASPQTSPHPSRPPAEERA